MGMDRDDATIVLKPNNLRLTGGLSAVDKNVS